MGDTRSWLIFLVGLLVVGLFAIALLAAFVTFLVGLVKKSSRKETPLNSDPTVGSAESDHPPADPSTYDVVSDTVVGFNLRKSDNRFQAIFILVSTALSAAVGVIAALSNSHWRMPWTAGALIGAFAGLVIGLFVSGALIMVFRATRHIQGHDK